MVCNKLETYVLLWAKSNVKPLFKRIKFFFKYVVKI